MSFDPPRIHASPTDAVLGTVVFQSKQPDVRPHPMFPFLPARPLPDLTQPGPLDGVTAAVTRLAEEVQGLRRDLWERYERVWFRRLARWLTYRWRWLRTRFPV